ncbi:MAG: hypothetical protein JJT81_06905 [Rubellimicrobium sp.]|nr:hypothetical protein [Rubellimicrobium sp.]
MLLMNVCGTMSGPILGAASGRLPPMRRVKAGIAGLLMLVPIQAQADADPDLAGRRGGLVDEIIFATETDTARLSGLIADGAFHLTAQGVTDQSVFQRIRDSELADYDLSFGGSVELTLNPVGPTFEDGTLNPFSVPAIREAMNQLIDRRFIAEEIYGGLARPRTLPIGTAVPDFARLAAEARAIELRYRHDPPRALAVIEAEMEALGAERQGGIWHFEGRPVTLRLVIRSDDARRQVGDYVANLLEGAGFQTERLYRGPEEASRIWIASDPAAGQWHMVTGAWVSTLVRRDSASDFDFYYTPRGRPDPLWQAYAPDPEFDRIAARLNEGDFADLEERAGLMARAIELAMQDSARIWLVDQSQIGPRAADVQVAFDLAGGVRGSQLWPLTLRFADRVGGQMRVAAPSVLTEPWNPVAGTNWLFDRMVQRAISDASVLPDPFTGLHRPQRLDRAELTVRTGTPVSVTLPWVTLDEADGIIVPDDAWIAWDEGEGRFLTVAETGQHGLEARTRAVLHYRPDFFARPWHDGSTVSLADVLVSWALSFSRADPDSPHFDPSHVPGFEVFERQFRGWRILSEDPFVLEVYSDQISLDAETMISQRVVSVLPWHVIGLAMLAEAQGELAFSSARADRLDAEWLSLVAGPSLPILDRKLDQARAAGTIPFPALLGPHLAGDAIAIRHDNIAAWRAARRHFQIGEGPYYLHSVHPIEGALVLRHFPDFPDPSDRWLGFADPPIPVLDLDGPLIVARGEDARFTIAATFAGAPVEAADIETARFLLFNGDGALVEEGEATELGGGNWEVAFDPGRIAALGMGPNSLEVVFTSRHVAMPVFASQPFATVPSRTAEW